MQLKTSFPAVGWFTDYYTQLKFCSSLCCSKYITAMSVITQFLHQFDWFPGTILLHILYKHLNMSLTHLQKK